MLSSIAGSIASLLGPSEGDRIQRTLSVLDAAPEDVPMAKLMVSKSHLPNGCLNINDRCLL